MCVNLSNFQVSTNFSWGNTCTCTCNNKCCILGLQVLSEILNQFSSYLHWPPHGCGQVADMYNHHTVPSECLWLCGCTPVVWVPWLLYVVGTLGYECLWLVPWVMSACGCTLWYARPLTMCYWVKVTENRILSSAQPGEFLNLAQPSNGTMD